MLPGGFSVIIPGGLSVTRGIKCYQGDSMLPGRSSVTKGIKCYQGD